MGLWKLDVLAVTLVGMLSITLGMYIVRAKGWNKLRRVAAVDASMEAVSVCAERGKPLIYNPGGLTIFTTGKPTLTWIPPMVGLLKYLATKAAEARVRIISVSYHPMTKIICADTAMQGYIAGGHPELYREADHYYYPDYVTGTYGVLSLIDEVNPGAIVALGGHWWYAQMPVYNVTTVRGIYTVGGDPWPDDQSAHAIGADYAVFAEEDVAAGAYLTNDPLDTSVLVGEDAFKIGAIAIIIIWFILTLLKVV